MWNKIQKIYIGDHYLVYPKWKPWANTLAYYPLEENTNDYSGNWHNWTPTNITYTTLASWKKVSVYTQGSSILNIGTIWWVYPNFTASIWIKFSWNNSAKARIWCIDGTNSWRTLLQPRKNTSWYIEISTYNGSTETHQSLWISPSDWKNFVVTLNSGVLYGYLNGVYVASMNSKYGGWSQSLSYPSSIGSESGSATNWWGWYMSEAILESKTRTAQEISDYYNSTKANYWL